MTNEEKRIKELRAEIKKYNDAYYSQNVSLVSDVEFDTKLKELEALEAKYPQYKTEDTPTDNVGSSLKNTKFARVKHDVPMLSLANSYNMHDVSDFTEKVMRGANCINPDFIIEVKLDGLSISIKYVDGKLVRAVTRGDGVVGEDVTENVKAIKSIPHTLSKPLTIEVRGEVVMPRSSFKMLNEIRAQNGEETFANPRNAASGTLRQLDSSVVAERNLDAYFYYIVNAEDFGIETQEAAMEYLNTIGLKTTGIVKKVRVNYSTNIEEIETFINYWETARQGLDYDTDGMVIKVNHFKYWKELGNTNKIPHWAIAYKFPAVQVTTKLNDVTWQVGRTGKLTPVAELEEVELGGTKVRRATLHNLNYIIERDIMVGDTVYIAKAAEIIPQVISVVKEARTGKEVRVIPPRKCPECGGDIKANTDVDVFSVTIDVTCTNPKCPSVIAGSIIYFASRKCMDIRGLGDEIVNRFVDLGLLKDISDVYTLKNHRTKILKLERFGEKSLDKLLETIENSKKNPYSRILAALGIPFVGSRMGAILAKHSGNIKALMSMKKEELMCIDSIGESVADAIVYWFSQSENRKLIQRLESYGVNFEQVPEATPTVTGEFTGKSVLFTGKLSHLTRNEASQLVSNMGGVNASSVSKSLDYLVVGEDAGSKLDKARAIGTVKILTEEEFMQIVRKMKQN